MSEGRLTICATPIGNLGDVSERLRETLCAADIIYAEDTRRTSKLLAHLGCRTKLRSLFTGNETARTQELVREATKGSHVVLVSDAGMPVVSDPGAEAVRQAREAGVIVSAVPGPSAVTTAFALSGFGGDRFVFEGFLPRKGNTRKRRIESIAGEERPVVLFASPRRLGDDLADLAKKLSPDREVVITRELTKMHEEIWVGSLAGAASEWSGDVKGEVTLVLGPGTAGVVTLSSAIEEAAALVKSGVSRSDAARQVSDDSGVGRRSIYQGLLENQDES